MEALKRVQAVTKKQKETLYAGSEASKRAKIDQPLSPHEKLAKEISRAEYYDP